MAPVRHRWSINDVIGGIRNTVMPSDYSPKSEASVVSPEVSDPLALLSSSSWGCSRAVLLLALAAGTYYIKVNVDIGFSEKSILSLLRTSHNLRAIAQATSAYLKEFGVHSPKRNTILGLVNKLETTGSLLSEKGKHRSSRLPTVVVDVRARLEQSPKKSLRRLSQETGYTYSMCQRAAKSAGLKPYRVTVVHQLQEPDKDKIELLSLYHRDLRI
ncbi:hypothetical protein ANN_19908 [Periplaneta americana]|uniref:Uncharacterized protein n=1 Tax=Periplaneta americana TaxID=6978 RepID=A0ABQ8SBU5_PERAM|nr:hypothetical protein ANN_19908 [Periplaneta americana]